MSKYYMCTKNAKGIQTFYHLLHRQSQQDWMIQEKQNPSSFSSDTSLTKKMKNKISV